MTILKVTERTKVRRVPQRGHYERDLIYSILDEALVIHVGFVVAGQSYVIPTTHVRIDDTLFIHGSAASRMLETTAAGVPLCATVTLVDALVFARSAFHHSMNYRSVVVLGQGRLVLEQEEKRRVLAALVERFAKGRAAAVRAPNALELKATHVLAIPLDEASAKVRSGPPLDDVEDLARPCWAGLVPVQLQALAPVPEATLGPDLKSPELTLALGLAR